MAINKRLSRRYLKWDTPPSSRAKYRTGVATLIGRTPRQQSRIAASESKSKRLIPDVASNISINGKIGYTRKPNSESRIPDTTIAVQKFAIL
jgi:hypothetical protein